MYNNQMWIIEPAIAKKVINYDIWTKNGYTVTTARYWRWAEVCIDNLTCPEIDVSNPDGINIWDRFKNEYENNDSIIVMGKNSPFFRNISIHDKYVMYLLCL